MGVICQVVSECGFRGSGQMPVCPGQKKISGPSHNALLPMGNFVQGVICIDSDETYLKIQDWMSLVILGMFHHYRCT